MGRSYEVITIVLSFIQINNISFLTWVESILYLFLEANKFPSEMFIEKLMIAIIIASLNKCGHNATFGTKGCGILNENKTNIS